MLSETFAVRFYETDALKHVSNTVVPQWFEAARVPVFKIFQPSLEVENWPLIMASVHIDFKAQMFFGQSVEVRTGISRIGTASFDVRQQVWQDGKLCAEGTTSMVKFDYAAQASSAISANEREQLQALSL